MENKKLIPELRFPEFKDDWKVKRVEELCSTFKSGIGITSQRIKKQDKYPVYGGNGLRGYTDSFTHDGFFVLIGRQGALCGNINRTNGKAFISEHAIAVEGNEYSDTEWLAQKFDFMKLNRLSESSAQPGLAVNKLLRIKINAPSSQEQQKIATFLSTVDKRIALLEQKKQHLEQYKKGVMQRLFNGLNCDSTDSLDFENTTQNKSEQSNKSHKSKFRLRFKDEQGNNYPDWEEKKLGEVLIIGSGKDYKHLETGDIPVYGTGGYMTSVNDFLFDGESVGIGRKGTIDKPVFLTGKFWTVDTLFYTHSFNNILPYFVFILFQQINWKNYNEASGVPSLSKSTLEKIKIVIPSLPEQQKIANFLSSLDKKIEHTNSQIKTSKEFKKGLLQKMFV